MKASKLRLDLAWMAVFAVLSLAPSPADQEPPDPPEVDLDRLLGGRPAA